MAADAGFPAGGDGGARFSAHQIAEAVKAGERGAGDALDNQPAARAATPSQTELTLLSRVRDLYTEIRAETANAFASLRAELLKRQESFSLARYEARVSGIEAAMRGKLNQKGGELEQRIYDALRAKREYEHFNYVHRRHSDPKFDKWQMLVFFLAMPLVVESMLNGSFFADASEFGLIGGTATAVIISALNVALGFILGVGPARYCQHVRASHLFWAVPLYVLAVGIIIVFNLAVGHYREMLMANPDARSLEVMPRLLANPLAINDLKSIALVIIGCIVALIAAYKGYTAFGSYPGHVAAYKRWNERARAVEEERSKLDSEVLPDLEMMRGQIDAFRAECATEAERLQGLRAGAQQARDRYEQRLAQLRSAKDAAVMQYREANLKVRTDIPPAYFSASLAMPEIDHPTPLAEHDQFVEQVEAYERQLSNLPALVELKVKDRLTLLRGLDLAGEVARVKTRAQEDGRAAHERDEEARRKLHAEFAETPRRAG